MTFFFRKRTSTCVLVTAGAVGEGAENCRRTIRAGELFFACAAQRCCSWCCRVAVVDYVLWLWLLFSFWFDFIAVLVGDAVGQTCHLA